MTVTQATMSKRAAAVIIAGTFAAIATTPSFARDRGAAIAAGVATGAVIGAAAVSAASGAYYYGAPYDNGPVYASDGYLYGTGDWGNTNSIGPNRTQMEHAN
jgi:hypothetical protein